MSIENENQVDWDQFTSKLVIDSKKIRNPLNGTFEITPRCNLSCKMCYVSLSPKELSGIGRERTTEEWVNIGKQAAAAGTLFLLLTGGEPFHRSDFREIYEELSGMGFLITVFTNGTLIDKDTVNWLKQRPPAAIRISIYGASNETYQKVCGISNGFDKVSNAINLMLEAGIKPKLSSTIIKDNVKDIYLLNEYANERGLIISHNPNVIGEVRGAVGTAKSVRLNIEQIDELISKDYNRVDAICNPDESYLFKCNKSNCGYWITWDGRMSMCSFMNEPHTYPFENGFISAWYELNERIVDITEPLECRECKYKAFCINCPGILCAESGHINKVSDRVCNLAKVFYKQLSKDAISKINKKGD